MDNSSPGEKGHFDAQQRESNTPSLSVSLCIMYPSVDCWTLKLLCYKLMCTDTCRAVNNL